jgi:hypothetical protein
MTENYDLTKEVDQLKAALAPAFQAMEWAEEEIETARNQIPGSRVAGRIKTSFMLLRPTHDLMSTEVVYRSHCREILERVARNQDTRPGTAAECCIALSVTSLEVPLSTTAAGLYARMWKLADLPDAALADTAEHYEALEGQSIDDAEVWLRNKLRQDWRRL